MRFAWDSATSVSRNLNVAVFGSTFLGRGIRVRDAGTHRAGWAKWMWGACCLVIALHFIAELAFAGPTVIRLGGGWEIGSNGVAVRVLWTRGEKTSIAWDDVSTGPRWLHHDYMFYCQFPVLGVFSLCFVVTSLLFYRDRKRNRRSCSD